MRTEVEENWASYPCRKAISEERKCIPRWKQLVKTIEASNTSPSADAPRRLPPETRRARIVDAAVAFFAEVGLEGSTRELSQRAGVTQPLLYKYFNSKANLLEAVFDRVYMDRIPPDLPRLITDRAQPIRERMITFYVAYAGAVLTYEWMRIFMFSGLAGEEFNARYLSHLRAQMLEPLLREIDEEANGEHRPDLEDIWNLHGSIVYLGIRKFVYQAPAPEDFRPQIERAVDRFLKDFHIAQRS
jgi:AcrR family transcriptional regulator